MVGTAPKSVVSHRRALLLPAGRCGARQPLTLLRLSCLAAPLLQGGKIRLSHELWHSGEHSGRGTRSSDMVPYLRMLVVGDIRARGHMPQASNHSAM